MTVLSQTTRTIFSGNLVASTGYVYNTSASSGSDDGWQNARYDDVIVQIGCATLTSAQSVVYRIEGRFGNSISRSASIRVGTISGVTSMDDVVVISEPFQSVRVGVKLSSMVASPSASPHNLYCSLGLTERR